MVGRPRLPDRVRTTSPPQPLILPVSPPSKQPQPTMSDPSSTSTPHVRRNHRPARRGVGAMPSYFPRAARSPPRSPPPPPRRRRITRAMVAPTNDNSSLAKFFSSFIRNMYERRLLVQDCDSDDLVVETLWKAYEILHRQTVTVAELRDVKEADVVRFGILKWVWGYVREESLLWPSDEDEENPSP